VSSDKLPDPYRGGGVPASRTGGVPVPRTGGVPARRDTRPAPPVHSARTLGFSDSPGREYWWRMLDDRVKARIAEKVGPAIEWWAYHHSSEEDRPYAVVFGPRGLAVTRPTMNNAGRPAQLVQVRRFVPDSVRHAIVKQQPSPIFRPPPAGSPASGAARLGGAAGPAGLGGAPGAARPGGAAPLSQIKLPLTGHMRGFLGNLPAEAQARLQEPFLSADPIQDSNFFYHGTDEELDVWCYLAGGRTVTFVSGRRVAPAGAPPHVASWQLICRRAEVVPG
jgi:hypothetical protein